MELERSFRIYFKSAEPDSYANCDRYLFTYSEQYRGRLQSFYRLYDNRNRESCPIIYRSYE
jgi:hypothetical protein